MTLRRTTAAIVVLTVLGLVATTYALSRVIVNDGFGALEDRYARRDLDRAQNAIETEVEQLRTTVLDWAWWDDTYQFSATGDPEYVRANATDSTLATLGLNVFMVVKPDGTVLLHRGVYGDGNAELPLPAELVDGLGLEGLSAEALESYELSGTLGLHGAPLMFAARPILTSFQTGPVHAVLVMGRYLDQATTERLSGTTLLDIAVVPADGAAAAEWQAEKTTKESIRAWEGLPTIGGPVAYTVELHLPRDIAQRGETMTGSLLIAVVVAGIAFAVAMFLLFERLVVRRLRAMGAAMASLGSKGDLRERLAVSGDDEVARLARDINAMLGSLEDSEARYRRVVEAAAEGIFLIRGGSVTFANQAGAELLGLRSADEAVGTRVSQFVPPALAGTFEQIESHLEEEGSLTLETTLSALDGEAKRTEVSLSRVMTPEGGALQVVARDVSERARAEQRRLATEKKIQETQRLESLGLLAGGIAHDFNNLLMTVLGNANLARMTIERGTEADEAVEEIEIGATRAAELTRQLLAYAGGGKLLVTKFDLSSVTNETVRLMRRMAGPRAELELDLAEGLPQVEADETQIRQVVMNLLTNAADAIGQDEGRIAVRTEVRRVEAEELAQMLRASGSSAGDYVSLEVRDTGRGIPAEAVARVFEPFFSTKGAGRGLGLSAVLGIVRSHGGAIAVESEVGVGTMVRVLFPAISDGVAADATTAIGDVTASAGRVLAVDDEPAVLSVTAKMLNRLGFTVATAVNGEEAVRACSDSRFDLVLLDVTMPIKTGIEALGDIRRTEPELPVILMSGHSFEALPNEAAEDDRVGFIQKPFTLVSLSEAIRNVGKGEPESP